MQVRAEVKKWALWLVNTFNLSGIRFDAVKHFSEDFQVELLQYLNANSPRELFYVGTAAVTLTLTHVRGVLERRCSNNDRLSLSNANENLLDGR